MPISEAWQALADRYHLPAVAAVDVGDRIAAAYAELHRAYHTATHIDDLLRLLDRHGADARDLDALVLAILFHDIVYDPTRHDNEAASARCAADTLTCLRLPPALIAKVERYILATRHGEPVDTATDPDLALLLDLDLSILAAPPAAYQAYAQAIRREYGHVPEALYHSGRRQVLEAFLARERIYRTALGVRWEAPARANLAAEIAELGGQ